MLWHSGLSQFATWTSHIKASFQMLAAILLIQLKYLERQQKINQALGCLATHMRDPNGVLCCWLWPDPDLTITGFWAVNQQMKDSMPLPLCCSVFQINKGIYFFKKSQNPNTGEQSLPFALGLQSHGHQTLHMLYIFLLPLQRGHIDQKSSLLPRL